MQTTRLVLLAAAPGFAILPIIGVFVYIFGQSERAKQASVLHTYRVMDQIRKVLADMQDAETGARGYLLTHEQSFLQPYHRSLSRVGAGLTAFKRLTADSPRQ